ncbi:hypothetical protein MEJ65_00055 [Candidatus Carsonella ruddii]|uniref:Uncharacterized protein n=1 Tax=Carsonella ruddii TaxID=114186 RepID=A0AAJ6FD50_CARRU|nr:hypothetical protein [Candidatus Carsonella ruddii]WGS66678.1 hypothetical protein MEJ66_00050 [Candidatus Carsonella ruddii]WGS66874.1 hypothetical protein MEJ62_00050 [Candidatus Carsonella ruddii]WGS67066.1 hypothetical protein MEJ60_00050 [Candidatus Carsonella ruddii]WGS67259.1 hypothetical protein MEJ65_00055 [Candidatus Carsonella ruddii]WMC18275.1 MAG: hypothetical protein NU472_00055 [Candidatus Carsonella ruddii]
MKIFIFSKKCFIKYNNIKILKIIFKKQSFEIMNNYVPTIGNIEFVFFYLKNKFYKIRLKNSYFISKNIELKIICDKYEFL